MEVVPEDAPLKPVLSVGLRWPLCETGSRPSMVRFTVRRKSWKRLCEHEAGAEQQLRERQWIEARKNELIHGARPHEAEILDVPSEPEDEMDIERHEVVKGRDASHFCSPAVREAAQIQVDFCFLREGAAAFDVTTDPVPENPWVTILCAVDVATQNTLAIALPGKNAVLEYAIWQFISFIKRLRCTELAIKSDGEPAITAIVDRLLAEIKKTGVQAQFRPEKTPRCSSQSLGAVGSMQA